MCKQATRELIEGQVRVVYFVFAREFRLDIFVASKYPALSYSFYTAQNKRHLFIKKRRAGLLDLIGF